MTKLEIQTVSPTADRRPFNQKAELISFISLMQPSQNNSAGK